MECAPTSFNGAAEKVKNAPNKVKKDRQNA